MGWIPRIVEDSTVQWGHRQPNIWLYEIWTASRGKKMDNCFLHVTEDKQKHVLMKSNVLFLFSNLQIPFNKCKSLNSHRKWKETYKSPAAGRGLLVNDWHYVIRWRLALQHFLREKTKRILHLSCSSDSVILFPWITQLVYIWWPFSAFKTVFNIKNIINIIIFPKIHWVLSVKRHLSPVKIFPSTAFLYKALITQFAESALETLRSEAWRILFLLNGEKERKRNREERRSSLSKIFIVMSTWLHLLWAYRGKRNKKWARRKRRKERKEKLGAEGRNKRKTTKVHPKPGILQAVIFQLIEKPLNKKK